jgi:hypothetical protein
VLEKYWIPLKEVFMLRMALKTKMKEVRPNKEK